MLLRHHPTLMHMRIFWFSDTACDEATVHSM
jgi:hypothetical protein